jgi:PPOX class probable F420-dependent enzyme
MSPPTPNNEVETFLAKPNNLILAGTRADGRPHLTPTWFCWDRQRFYVSTTHDRVKYSIFRRDPRAELAIDDPAHLRCVLVSARVQIREDIEAQLPRFQAIRQKYGLQALGDDGPTARCPLRGTRR